MSRDMGEADQPSNSSIRGSGVQQVFVVLFAILSLIIPARPAHAFLEGLQCEMDPLYDMCIGIEIERTADPMERGAIRDTAFLAAYTAWYFSHRSDAEKKARPPKPSHYRAEIKSRSIDQTVTAIHRILYEKDTAAGLAEFDQTEGKIQRLVSYPYIIIALLQRDESDAVDKSFEDYATLIGTIRSPGRRLAAFAEMAYLASGADRPMQAQKAIASFRATVAKHPSAEFRTLALVDIAPSEFLVSGGNDGTQDLVAAARLLTSMTGLPVKIRANALARIARANGRIGDTVKARAFGRKAYNLLSELAAKDKLAVLEILFQAGIAF